MTVIVWIGLVLVAGALGGLGWCVFRALRLKREGLAPEETNRVMGRLMAANTGLMAMAFIGLGLMLIGAVL